VSRRALYDRVAEETASVVIRRYSTSFGLAARLLGGDVRQHVENIYALVRVADEIVDGAAEESGLDRVGAARQLNELERETDAAVAEGFSSNLVVHAFALTARETGFGTEYTAPFFESMRTDLTATEHDAESFDRYVYGSAEVVGLMCLRAFLQGVTLTDAENDRFVTGARALPSRRSTFCAISQQTSRHWAVAISPASASIPSQKRTRSACSTISTTTSASPPRSCPTFPRAAAELSRSRRACSRSSPCGCARRPPTACAPPASAYPTR
jgi:hypothetical protein